MAKYSLPNSIRTLKSTFLLLRSEPEAMVQFRQLILVVLICTLSAYGVNKAIVEPKINENRKLQEQLDVNTVKNLGQDLLALTTRFTALQQLVTADQHKLAVLDLKEKFIREHWQSIGDNDQYNRLVFTLLNSAPVNFEKNILKTTHLASRNHDGFDLFPMILEGRSDFIDFFKYLRFLEYRPEIVFLDEVKLSAISNSDISPYAEVEFMLSIGRLELQNDK